jgi:S1-C subfamily serine protease
VIKRAMAGLCLAWVVALAAGCVPPPSSADQDAVDGLSSPSASATIGGTLAGGNVDAAAWASVTSTARHSVLRVRNQTCDGLATGSGFVYAPRTLITNAHVVEGARRLSVDTADGVTRDIAVVHTSEELPRPLPLAATDAVPGDLVQALGFPLGKQFDAASGRVTGYVDGKDYQHTGQVLQSSVRIRPGNSGGPLLDRTAHVVGVMFAIDLTDGSALAIPASRLRQVLTSDVRTAVTETCPSP